MKVSHAFIGLGVLASSFLFVPSTLATTYQREVDVEFTFNSILNVSITSEDDPTHADIEILDLIPGQSHDSNIVDVAITTNSVMGYTASATVGNAQNASTSMMHENGTNAFTSIATDASEASLATDNTWGYSTSIDNGSTWANFSGLPLYTTETPKILRTTSDPVNETLKFKINAKAATTQVAGDYTNVINFTVVANVPPRDFPDVIPSNNPRDPETHLPTIQSISEDICGAVEAYDTQFQVTDIRDHKNYWISKLQDGHCWMTQNLDLDLDNTVIYTNQNTDLGWNGSSYSTASWQPANSTIISPDTGWQESNTAPYSYDAGDLYWVGWSSDNGRGSNAFSSVPTSGIGTHGHIGNHYNWSAAIASNDSSSYSSSTYNDVSNNPQNSICPANWRLPTSSSDSTKNEFRNLLNAYGAYITSGNPRDEKVASSPMWFVRSGYYSGSLNLLDDRGYYWSSTVAGSRWAQYMYFTTGYIATEYDSGFKKDGHSIRCVVRDTGVGITFNPNGGTGNTIIQRVKKNQDETLSANNYTRSGYVFNGWNTRADGLGEGYGNRATINTNSDITLYAQWKQDDGSMPGITIQRAFELAYTQHEKGMYEETTPGSGIYQWIDSWGNDDYQGQGRDVRFAMQDINLTYNNTKVCDLVTVIGDQYQALDVRDNKLYYVSKLADGRCWMTQNLDLRLSTATTLTPATTDIPQSWTSPVSTDDMVSRDEWWSDVVVDPTCDNSNPYMNSTPPFSLSGNGLYWDGTKTGSSVMEHASSSGNPHWQIGVAYSFGAATAIDNTSTLADGTVVDQSICPANWRIPDASVEPGGFPYLMSVYGSPMDVSQAPLYLTYTGYVYLINSSSFAYVSPYYTLNKVQSNNSCSNALRYFQPGNAPSVGGSIPPYYGMPVRCIAR